jgi:triphosphoribosyl-dephospho-CoA synthase
MGDVPRDELKHSSEIDRHAWAIGEAFLKGILLEIAAHPKPGLVSLSSMGAHNDMNILTFMASSAVIAPALYLCAQGGMDHQEGIASLLPLLRSIGANYEKKLLASTKGINTQRGILFSAGILCGAAGFAWRSRMNLSSEILLTLVKEMARGLVSRELGCLIAHPPGKTAGEKLYLLHGTTGIRGEVEAGFPSVSRVGLPALTEGLSRAETLNDSLVHALLSLMTIVEDSTIIWRKGTSQLLAVQAAAAEILDKGSVFAAAGRAAILKLDQDLTREGIGPGGSADLLAVTIGLYLLENGQFPVAIR